jgi:hypothetical protein
MLGERRRGKPLIIILKMSCQSEEEEIHKLLSVSTLLPSTSISPQPKTMTEISFNIKHV